LHRCAQNEEQERTRSLQSHVETHGKQVEELENNVRYLKAQVLTYSLVSGWCLRVWPSRFVVLRVPVLSVLVHTVFNPLYSRCYRCAAAISGRTRARWHGLEAQRCVQVDTSCYELSVVVLPLYVLPLHVGAFENNPHLRVFSMCAALEFTSSWEAERFT
jgi:hypothetical protein